MYSPEKILQFLNNFEKRPNVFLWGRKASFKECVYFLQGVISGLELATDVDIEREISAWFQAEFSQEGGNMNWFAQVEATYADLNDQERFEKMIELLRNFFVQRESFK